MFPNVSRGIGQVQPVVFSTVHTIAQTAAGTSFKRLAQASGFAVTDRLLIVGVVPAAALTTLIAAGAREVTIIRPDQPYPSQAKADVVWLLDAGDPERASRWLKPLARRLASDGRLAIELASPADVAEAEVLAIRLRVCGLHTVRIERLRSGGAIVRGSAPAERQRAA